MVKRLLSFVLASMIFAGSAGSKEPKAEIEILDLIQMFPGHWDNTAQVQAEAAKGAPQHEAIVLDIVPIDAIMLGDHVFYVQESIAGDPRRVLGQKVVMFGVVKKKIIQTDFALTEPNRWRNGQNNPDLFKGIMTADVRSIKGCSLSWKRTESGDFAGANEAKTCHNRIAGAGVAAIDLKAELSPTEYATAEQAVDRSGHPLSKPQGDLFYRFRRQSRDVD
ncbi:MAG: chromophore lyase CpcT/CpeT [Proteobacteria bacterium]|nr:chromophore lyase CpcT/CpeT [Pseudomonadota bacterium]